MNYIVSGMCALLAVLSILLAANTPDRFMRWVFGIVGAVAIVILFAWSMKWHS